MVSLRMRKKYERHNPWIYAAYKGDEFLCEGTKEEICDILGIKVATFHFYRTNYYKKNRDTGRNNRRIIMRVDGKDKIWNEEEEREEGI